ncbi:MAG: diguanylate cyclase [Formivibrio sp.]|nr:diguanylate cyclase [Formivibrio sp.]
MPHIPTLREFVIRRVPCLSVDDSLAQASRLLAREHANHLVVLHATKPVGVLTPDSLLDAWCQGSAGETRLDRIPLTVVPSLTEDTDWQEALRCLVEPMALGMVLVIDKAGALQGLLTEEDFCHQLGLSQLAGAHTVLDAVSDSEQKLKMVFDCTRIFLGLLEPDGRVIIANRAALELIPAKLQDVVGLPFWEAPWWMHDIKLQTQVHDAVVMAQRGEVSGFEANHVVAGGELIHIDFTLRPISDDAGAVRYLLPEGRDVTERRRAEWALQASQIHYQALLNASPVGVIELDAAGHCIYVNEKYIEITGQSLTQALGDGWVCSIHPDDWDQLALVKAAVYSRAEAGHLECRYLLPDGQVAWMVGQAVPMRTSSGVVSGMILTLVDITEHKELEIRLRLAASMYETSSEGILVVDAQNHIVSVNPAFTTLLGYEATEVLGRDPGELGASRNAPSLYKNLWLAVEKSGHWQGEIWNCCKDGQEVALWMTVNTLFNSEGKVQWRFALFSDITEKKRNEELIWHQANYDALTGLPNRRLFRDRLQQEMKKAARYGISLALFFIDLDHFKDVNDCFGHDCGDRLLVEAGERIRRCLRDSDTVARLGGDEFTAILPNITELRRAEDAALAITQTLAQPFVIDGQESNVSASIGIAFYPQDGATDLVLLKQADRAMYLAKAKGRNCFSCVQHPQ